MSPRFTQEALTPEELNKLAEVSLSDVELARSAWKKDAPAPYRNLLEATVVSEDDIDGEA